MGFFKFKGKKKTWNKGVSLFVLVNDFVIFGLILFRFASNLGKNNWFILCLVLQVFLVKRSFCFWGVKGKRKKMNQCGYQQKKALTSCEEMRMESVVCPKPRRLGLLNHSTFDNHIRPLRPPFIKYSPYFFLKNYIIPLFLLNFFNQFIL